MFFAGPKKYSAYSDTAASTSKDHPSASRPLGEKCAEARNTMSTCT
jgi:hypothetical protein